MVRFPALLFALVASASALASSPGPAVGDRLVVAREWLAGNPDDADTLRFLGGQLVELERFEEAAGAFDRAVRLKPAEGDPVPHIAALVRLGRMEAARTIAEAAEARMTTTKREAPRGAALKLVARAMAMAGEIGRARVVLDTALAQAPNDVGLLLERAEIEMAAGRAVHAVAFTERAAALAPADPAPRRAQIRALQAAGMPVRAARAFDAARAARVAVDEGMLAAALAALHGYGDHRAAVDLAEAHIERFPKSAPLLRALAISLAAIGADQRAAEQLHQALTLGPPDAEVIRLIDTVIPEDQRAAVLTDLRRRFPWLPELFQAGGRPPRDLAWPWLAEAAAMDRAHALAHLARGAAEIPDRLRGQRARLLVRAAELDDDTESALARLDQADRLDHPRGAVLAARFKILAGASRWDAAAPVAWDWARTRPDDADALATLFTPEVADRIGWARVFAHLHDHVQRDPEDPDRRMRALERHAGAGGSPVVALSHAHALDRLVAGDDPRRAVFRAVQDKVTAMVDGLGRVADLDLVAGRLALHTDSGRLEARFDLATGRLLRFALGEEWIAAEWSPDGLDLISLSDGAGNALLASRRDGRLNRIEARGRAAFRADIAPDGTPTAIIAPGSAPHAALQSYNSAIALLETWPRTGLAGARWLKIGQ